MSVRKRIPCSHLPHHSGRGGHSHSLVISRICLSIVVIDTVCGWQFAPLLLCTTYNDTQCIVSYVLYVLSISAVCFRCVVFVLLIPCGDLWRFGVACLHACERRSCPPPTLLTAGKSCERACLCHHARVASRLPTALHLHSLPYSDTS
jgi:hypothetical protein